MYAYLYRRFIYRYINRVNKISLIPVMPIVNFPLHCMKKVVLREFLLIGYSFYGDLLIIGRLTHSNYLDMIL